MAFAGDYFKLKYSNVKALPNPPLNSLNTPSSRASAVYYDLGL
jgi:hypothetical protein